VYFFLPLIVSLPFLLIIMKLLQDIPMFQDKMLDVFSHAKYRGECHAAEIAHKVYFHMGTPFRRRYLMIFLVARWSDGVVAIEEIIRPDWSYTFRWPFLPPFTV
jgi:hypothetical protein